MPLPNHSSLPPTAKPRPRFFDVWNSASIGHQVGDNLSGSTLWKVDRVTRLQAQLEARAGIDNNSRSRDTLDKERQWGDIGKWVRRGGKVIDRDQDLGMGTWIGGSRVAKPRLERNSKPKRDPERVFPSDGTPKRGVKPREKVEKSNWQDDEMGNSIKSCGDPQNELKKKGVKPSNSCDRSTLQYGVKESKEDERIEVVEKDIGEDIPKLEWWEQLPPSGQLQRSLCAADDLSSERIPTAPRTHTPITRSISATITATTTTAQAPTTRFPPHTALANPPNLRKPIFANLTIHLSGPTGSLISDHALKLLLVSHGARLAHALTRRGPMAVTHVVLGQSSASTPVSLLSCKPASGAGVNGAGGALAARKMQREVRRLGGGGMGNGMGQSGVGGGQRKVSRESVSGRGGVRYVAVEWVLASVKAGKRLAEGPFTVGGIGRPAEVMGR